MPFAAGASTDVWGWLGLAICLGLPGVVSAAANTGVLGASPARRGMAILASSWASALLAAAIVFSDHRPLAGLGLVAPTPATVVWGVGVGAAGIVLYPILFPLLQRIAGASPANASDRLLGLPLWVRALILVTAVVTEEWVYRAYGISAVRGLTNSALAAAAIPLVLFVLAHLPSYGRAHLVYVSVVGLLLTALFVVRRDLLSNMIAHLIVDAVPLLLLPVLARRRAA